MQELTFDTSRQYHPPQKKPAKKILILFIVIVLILLIGAFFIFGKGMEQEARKANETPTPTLAFLPTDTPEPSPTPTEEVTPTKIPTKKPSPLPTSATSKTSNNEKSKLSLTVLNGSGKPGAAKEVADYLAGLGYTIVSTGNADTFDYTDVSFNLKSSNSDFLLLLKKDLATKYTVGTTSATLSAGDAGGQVIVGK